MCVWANEKNQTGMKKTSKSLWMWRDFVQVNNRHIGKETLAGPKKKKKKGII